MNMNVEYGAVCNEEIIRLNKHIVEYKEIFNSIIEPHIMIDENLTFTYANEAACLLLNQSREQLAKLKLSDFLQASILLKWDEEGLTRHKKPLKERKAVQLHNGSIKEMEFIQVGTLSGGKRIFRLEDLSEIDQYEKEIPPQMALENFDTAKEGIILLSRKGLIL